MCISARVIQTSADGGGEAVGKCAMCGLEATLKCSGCRLTYYCDKEHQKSHWKEHKGACQRAFQVQSTPELGRHLVAARRIAPRDVVVSEAPLVVGPPFGRPSAPVCLPCGAPIPAALASSMSAPRCPRCLWPTCGADSCSSGTSRSHAAECVILSTSRERTIEALTGHQVTEEQIQTAYGSITPLRCLLLQRVRPEQWKTLRSMESHPGQPHSEDIPKVTRFLREVLNLGRMDGSRMDEKTARRWDFSPATIARVCSVLDVNALDIRLPGPSDAVALYADTCLLEHSCVPNTRHSFDERQRIQVSATRAIEAGEHLTTMYTHVLWATQQRRDHLKVTKYFECTCQRCADPTEMGTFIAGLRCLGCNGGVLLPKSPLLGIHTEWECSDCTRSGQAAMLSGEQVRSLVLGLGSEVERALEERPPSSTALQDLLQKLETLLHPHNSHCLAVKHSLLQMLGRSGHHDELRRKETMCRDLLGVYRALDPTLARVGVYAAVAYFELHSTLVELWRKKLSSPESNEARKKLTEAKFCLEETVKLLQEENKNLPEGRLMGVAKSALEDIGRWLDAEKES
ncbi:SET domain-containing protein SmydA-8-like isoform X2 [Ischnura elegans]|uniref:SET domain-containing protein SmydA-8-like isoform X2 n=1 Tax=Ischnura elegans TaxID=197161 RepID=UPI001ED8A133|nr:SET domain-containing protein SmydA-8-like isoform X2 [Ischnura elegans]